MTSLIRSSESKSLFLLAEEYLKCSLAKSNTYLGVNYPLPHMSFDLKGRTAGLAYPGLWKIKLNHFMLSQHKEEFIYEVIPHELAHLMVYRFYGQAKKNSIKPHGSEWQSLMKNCFLLEPKRTHHFITPLREVTHFIYRCNCQPHMLSTTRHNKIINKKMRYSCKVCHSLLIFTGEQKTVQIS